MTKEARFDWVLKGMRQGPNPSFDVDFCMDEYAAVIPTMGSLVSGWLLIVPRVPVLSISELNDADQEKYMEIVIGAAAEVKDLAKHTFMFEHGPCLSGSLVGCGVDQAHTHVVPLNFDLISTCLENTEWDWSEVNCSTPWSSISEGQHYYLISNFERAYVAYPSEQASQFFRRKIAQGLGVENEWDYKLYPNKENALRTIEHLAKRKYPAAA